MFSSTPLRRFLVVDIVGEPRKSYTRKRERKNNIARTHTKTHLWYNLLTCRSRSVLTISLWTAQKTKISFIMALVIFIYVKIGFFCLSWSFKCVKILNFLPPVATRINIVWLSSKIAFILQKVFRVADPDHVFQLGRFRVEYP